MSQSLQYKKEFEQIVLTGNVEEALKSLVPNSKEKLYVRFIEELKSCIIIIIIYYSLIFIFFIIILKYK